MYKNKVSNGTKKVGNIMRFTNVDLSFQMKSNEDAKKVATLINNEFAPEYHKEQSKYYKYVFLSDSYDDNTPVNANEAAKVEYSNNVSIHIHPDCLDEDLCGWFGMSDFTAFVFDKFYGTDFTAEISCTDMMLSQDYKSKIKVSNGIYTEKNSTDIWGTNYSIGDKKGNKIEFEAFELYDDYKETLNKLIPDKKSKEIIPLKNELKYWDYEELDDNKITLLGYNYEQILLDNHIIDDIDDDIDDIDNIEDYLPTSFVIPDIIDGKIVQEINNFPLHYSPLEKLDTIILPSTLKTFGELCTETSEISRIEFSGKQEELIFTGSFAPENDVDKIIFHEGLKKINISCDYLISCGGDGCIYSLVLPSSLKKIPELFEDWDDVNVKSITIKCQNADLTDWYPIDGLTVYCYKGSLTENALIEKCGNDIRIKYIEEN